MEKKENGAEIPQSTWRTPLPEDEIARQEDMRSRLERGMEVEIRGLGRFVYNGVWDTMHTFYPLDPRTLAGGTSAIPTRYIRRDFRGTLYLQLPYTLLADYITGPYM